MFHAVEHYKCKPGLKHMVDHVGSLHSSLEQRRFLRFEGKVDI